MMPFLITIHILVCAGLILLILVQRGRGGGLVEAFSGVDAMFGPKTNAFLSRTTSTLAIVFFATCLSLALLSARQSRSLMRNIKAKPETQAAGVTETPAPVTPDNDSGQNQPPKTK